MDSLVVRSILGSKSGVVSVLERTVPLLSRSLLLSISPPFFLSLSPVSVVSIVILLCFFFFVVVVAALCRGNCTLPRPTADAATTITRAFDGGTTVCRTRA